MFKRQKSGRQKLATYLFAGLLCFSMFSGLLPFMGGQAEAQAGYNYFGGSNPNDQIIGPQGTFTFTGGPGQYKLPDSRCSSIITASTGNYYSQGGTRAKGGTYGELQQVDESGYGANNCSKAKVNIRIDPALTLPGLFLDHSNIDVLGTKFRDDKIDQDQTFKIVGAADSCAAKSNIDLDLNIPNGTDGVPALQHGKIHIFSIPPKTGNCKENTFDFVVSTVPGGNPIYGTFGNYFIWSGENRIVTSDATNNDATGIFDKDSTGDYVAKNVSGKCYSSIKKSADNKTGMLTLRNDKLKEGWPKSPPQAIRFAPMSPDGSGCNVSAPILIYLGHTADATKTGFGTLGGDGESEDGGGGPPGPKSPTCESSGFSLSWIICPVINLAADAADGIFTKFILPLLNTPAVNVDTAHPSGIFQVWSSFRTFGNVFLIIALLVMVFGQAIGGGLIDSYTVKKIAPRLLIAAILINLSIYLVALAVDVTNIIGGSINSLITAPVKDSGKYMFTVGGGAGAFGFASLLGLAFGAYILGPALITFLIMAVVIPGALAIIGVAVTLILRRGIIIMLIIVSPLAFALWCLPNTEQYFRKWWDLLFRTLMVYPLIMVMFAVAHLMAVIIADPDEAHIGNFLGQVVAMIVIILPLFLVPFAFKFAGGVTGAISGAVMGIRRRASRPISGVGTRSAGRRIVSRAKDIGAGNFIKGNHLDAEGNPANWQGRVNRRLARTSAIGKGGFSLLGLGLTRQSRQERRASATGRIDAEVSRRKSNAVEEFLQSDQAKPLIGNETLLQAGAYVGRDGRAGSEASIREFLENADREYVAAQAAAGNVVAPKTAEQLAQEVASVREATRSVDQQVYSLAAAAATAGTGTGYAGGQGEMLAAINSSAGGDRAIAARTLNLARRYAASAKRPDLEGTGFGESLTAMETQYNNGNTPFDQDASTIAMDIAVLEAKGASELASARNNQLQRLMPVLVDRYLRQMQEGDVAGATETAAELATFRDAMRVATPENRETIIQGLEQVNIRLDAGNVEEQFGEQLETRAITVGEQGTAAEYTQEVRNRAGLWDPGGRVINQQQPPINPGGGNQPPTPAPQAPPAGGPQGPAPQAPPGGVPPGGVPPAPVPPPVPPVGGPQGPPGGNAPPRPPSPFG